MTENERRRHLPLAGTYNVRDIGGYGTPTGRTTRWRTFLRADSLHRLPASAQQALLNYGVRTIIDLRHEQEVAEAPNVFAGSSTVNYVNLALLAGNKPSAKTAMLPDLEAIYQHILDNRQAMVKTIFTTMHDEKFPLLIHCTAGKDRTGVITALLLGLAGVDGATIAADYALTAQYATPMYDELRSKAAAEGRDMVIYERYLESKPEAMVNTLAHLQQHYGGAATYLRQIGLTEEQLMVLRNRILE